MDEADPYLVRVVANRLHITMEQASFIVVSDPVSAQELAQQDPILREDLRGNQTAQS